METKSSDVDVAAGQLAQVQQRQQRLLSGIQALETLEDLQFVQQQGYMLAPNGSLASFLLQPLTLQFRVNAILAQARERSSSLQVDDPASLCHVPVAGNGCIILEGDDLASFALPQASQIVLKTVWWFEGTSLEFDADTDGDGTNKQSITCVTDVSDTEVRYVCIRTWQSGEWSLSPSPILGGCSSVSLYKCLISQQGLWDSYSTLRHETSLTHRGTGTQVVVSLDNAYASQFDHMLLAKEWDPMWSEVTEQSSTPLVCRTPEQDHEYHALNTKRVEGLTMTIPQHSRLLDLSRKCKPIPAGIYACDDPRYLGDALHTLYSTSDPSAEEKSQEQIKSVVVDLVERLYVDDSPNTRGSADWKRLYILYTR